VAEGAIIISSTVTVAVALALLLFKSVTVRVTVLAPMFEMSNEAGETVMEQMLHASDEPLSTSLATMEAAPLLSSWVVTS
jgi:hypothetical protein